MLVSPSDNNRCCRQDTSWVKRSEFDGEANNKTLDPDDIPLIRYDGKVDINQFIQTTDTHSTASTSNYLLNTNYEHCSITNHRGNTKNVYTQSTTVEYTPYTPSSTLRIHLITNCRITLTNDAPTILNHCFYRHFIPTPVSNHTLTTSPTHTTLINCTFSNHAIDCQHTQTTNHAHSKYDSSSSSYPLLTNLIKKPRSTRKLGTTRKPSHTRNLVSTRRPCHSLKTDLSKKTSPTRKDHLHMPLNQTPSLTPTTTASSTSITHDIGEGHGDSQMHGKFQGYGSAYGFGCRKTGTTWLRVLLTLLAALPTLAEGGYGHPTNSLGAHGHPANNLGRFSISRQDKKDIFVHDNKSGVVTAQAGATAKLHCHLTSPLADGMVSWVRRRNYQVLTVGRAVYSSDVRVGVEVSIDGRDWVLTIRYVTTQDAGLYECQVSSHPPQAIIVNLHVVEAHAEIVGGSERYIHHGSSLLLVCLLKGATEAPVYVFWYRGHRMINYDTEHGVTVDNSRQASKLYMASVSRREEGNYTCVPSNAAQASVSVIIIHKENPAGLQQETNTEKEASSPLPSSSSALSSSVAVLLFLVPLHLTLFTFPFICCIIR